MNSKQHRGRTSNKNKANEKLGKAIIVICHETEPEKGTEKGTFTHTQPYEEHSVKDETCPGKLGQGSGSRGDKHKQRSKETAI